MAERTITRKLFRHWKSQNYEEQQSAGDKEAMILKQWFSRKDYIWFISTYSGGRLSGIDLSNEILALANSLKLYFL